MVEEFGGQVQTFSMRMTAGLRGRLEAMREVASLRRGGAAVTTVVLRIKWRTSVLIIWHTSHEPAC